MGFMSEDDNHFSAPGFGNDRNYDIIDAGNGKFIKAWTRGGLLDDKAKGQLIQTAQMPFIFKWLAAMPDTHWGLGATVGTVLPTKGAVIPSAVGVDIGCGMIAVRTNLTKPQFMEALGNYPMGKVRGVIESHVPAGRTHDGDRKRDVGSWGNIPARVANEWHDFFAAKYDMICERNPGIKPMNDVNHLGTLGTGNHFIELEEDENQNVWVMIHSGSRGPGNKFGSYFIKLAKELCKKWYITLPNPDLAYLPEGTPEFDRYMFAVNFAQKFAWSNRLLMLEQVKDALTTLIPNFELTDEQVHCHHNYVVQEKHFGEKIWVTRKGAVRAGKGELGLIPGSMGDKSYVVRGKGNRESFETCSHGAGRTLGRIEAKKKITLEQHRERLKGVECAADATTLDESPAAYKPIELVMEAQKDLVEIVHTFKQFLCVKGGEEVKD